MGPAVEHEGEVRAGPRHVLPDGADRMPDTQPALSIAGDQRGAAVDNDPAEPGELALLLVVQPAGGRVPDDSSATLTTLS
jgi:hypothetical protein